MTEPAPRRKHHWKLIPAGLALVALWAWTPRAPSPLPAIHAQPQDAKALAALPPDTAFLIEARLQVVDGAPGKPWQGRDVYIHRMREDLGGHGTSRHVVVQTMGQRRPALQLHWSGSSIHVNPDSYRLDHAPRIEPAPGDAWDRSSRGFRNGDTLLALGRTGRNGACWIESLLDAPLAAVHDDIRNTQRPRLHLWLAAKLIASLFILSLVSPIRGGRAPAAGNSQAGR